MMCMLCDDKAIISIIARVQCTTVRCRLFARSSYCLELGCIDGIYMSKEMLRIFKLLRN
jgi:hypothetical protein